MSDSQPTSGDSPRVEPSFDGDSAPSVDPPRLELLPYALADRAPPRAGLSKAVVWASSLAAGLALIAGVAAAALYDHAPRNEPHRRQERRNAQPRRRRSRR